MAYYCCEYLTPDDVDLDRPLVLATMNYSNNIVSIKVWRPFRCKSNGHIFFLGPKASTTTKHLLNNFHDASST